MIQEDSEVAVRVEVAMNAFCLMRHGEQNGVIIEAFLEGAGNATAFVPMCFHGFEMVLKEVSVAAVCGTYEVRAPDEVVVCALPM